MMPDYQSFLSGANLEEFWANVKWLLFYVAPVIMIFVAVYAVGHVVKMVRSSIGKESVKDDDDDDYEVYRY